MLSWWFYKVVSKVEPGQQVVFDSTLTCQGNGYVWISVSLTTMTRKIPETLKYD